MIVFLDFEASSLSDYSYPIEIGWAGEDGSTEQHLIRPAPGWTDWSATAESVHRIERDQLLAEGEPHDQVARRTLEALAPHEVFVTAPSWDGKWMSVLLRSAGLPRHALRLKDADEAHLRTISQTLGSRLPPSETARLAPRLIAHARRRVEGPVLHRALGDAEAELRVWREIAALAEAQLLTSSIETPGKA